MFINFLEEVIFPELTMMQLVGAFMVLIIPIFFLLLIARFRGFLASIFFLPLVHGLLYFACTFEQVGTYISNLGELGEGIEIGLLHIIYLFNFFHFGLMNYICNMVKVEMVSKILLANWFAFVPYLVLFVIFFAIFKRKKKRKEEDYF